MSICFLIIILCDEMLPNVVGVWGKSIRYLLLSLVWHQSVSFTQCVHLMIDIKILFFFGDFYFINYYLGRIDGRHFLEMILQFEPLRFLLRPRYTSSHILLWHNEGEVVWIPTLHPHVSQGASPCKHDVHFGFLWPPELSFKCFIWVWANACIDLRIMANDCDS